MYWGQIIVFVNHRSSKQKQDTWETLLKWLYPTGPHPYPNLTGMATSCTLKWECKGIKIGGSYRREGHFICWKNVNNWRSEGRLWWFEIMYTNDLILLFLLEPNSFPTSWEWFIYNDLLLRNRFWRNDRIWLPSIDHVQNTIQRLYGCHSVLSDFHLKKAICHK